MPPEPSWKMWARRFWSLGYARVFLVLAILLAVVALLLPMWAITNGTPGSGDWETTVYGWTSRTRDEYNSGILSTTRTDYYAAPNFPDPTLASALGVSYILVAIYLIALVVVVILFSSAWAKTMAPMLLLVISIVVVLVALLALFYPLAVIPGAADTDLVQPAVTGFWGSSPPWTWGAGLAWWLLLVSVVLGCLGAGLPYVKAMRIAPVSRPRAWEPQR